MHFLHVQCLHGVNHLFQLLGVQGTGLGKYQHLFTESHQGGDGGNAGLGGELLLGFGVHLREQDVRVLLGNSTVGRPKLLAGSTPFGPEVNQDNVVAFNG